MKSLHRPFVSFLAEKNMTVRTDPPVAGAWNWISDTKAHWRPEHYYAPGTRIDVAVNTFGLELSEGLYGQADAKATLTIGDSRISVANDITKQVSVFENGRLLRTMPTSMGRGGTSTIGDKTFHLLRSMGVATIGTLSQIPMEMMEKVLGKSGIDIWKKANGIDTTPVIPYWEQKSISAERTFDTDTTDLVMLNNTLVGMVEKIAYELRKEEKLTSCVTVKIRYSNFDTHTLQQRIPYTSFDHKLIELAKSLFVRLYQRRMLIRLIGLKFSHLVQGTPQLNLFEDTPEMVRLYQEIDRMRGRYGKKAVGRAVGSKE